MRDLIIQVITEESKKLLKESGIRDIKKLSKRYQMAKIYFHQDLDGVTTALAMKNYLENNGIKVVDAEIIQYGSKEFAIHKPEGEGDIMPVLVDFAHGKPMFVIHTDHHDTQAGVEQGTSTNFKPSRSNVETISQSISPRDIFSQDDIETISMIDSADFAKHDITPQQVLKYLFQVDKTKGVKENKKMMGLVANKLLLAFKNKPGFLKKLVMDAKPSLQSILLNIKDIMEKEGYASIDQLIKNQESYIESRKEKGVTYEDGIISQYTLGPTQKSGGYDRYTPFINHPDAEFLVTGLPMGMVQASCNPYKKERALKGVDLGEIKNEVLEKFRPELEKQRISFGTLKRISEMDSDKTSVGFTFKDFLAIYGNSPSLKIYGTEKLEKYLDYMSKKLFKSIPAEDRKVFNKASVNGYDVIMANSGGHKCITNISGINYLYSNSKFQEPEQRVRESYVDLLKDIQAEFVKTLKEKIKSSTKIQEKYITKKKILSSPTSILLNPKNLIKEQKISLPLIIKDGYSAPKGDADALHSFERRKKDGFGGKMTTKIGEKLKEIYNAGINPDVVNINITVDSKNYTVQWEATLDESQDGNAYMGVSTRGSAGGGADIRALGQVGPLKKELEKMGARNITQVLDFNNKSGVKIRQYFFKYTLPEKYPPHETSEGLYSKTTEPSVINLSDDKSLETNQGQLVGDILNFGSLKSNLSQILKNKIGSLFGSKETSDEDDTKSTQTSTATVSQTSGSDSDFMEITKKVIANFEGGYWNGSTSKNESTSKLGICKNHPKGSMGSSTETMFGLDRYNGNIESTPEGKQFFEIIDNQKEELGMDAFCKKWKWLYRGGENEEELKELAAKIMKRSFDRNMSNFVKDQEVKDKIMKNKGLLVHMTYACWNGPGFFKKFANELTDAVKQGKSDSELIDVAINSRANTKLLNKDKVAAAIKNPDGMKTA
jgi:hypothetical protein